MKKIIFGLSFLFCTNTFAAKLVWDANTETDLKGYKIYQGIASGVYTQTFDVGNVTVFPLANLTPKTTYFFVVTAYNTAGIESGFSTEVKFTPLAAPSNPRVVASIFPQAAKHSEEIWNTDLSGVRLTERPLLLSSR